MRKLVFLICSLVPALLTNAQYNLSLSPDEDYCYHMRSAEKQLKLYQNPAPGNALLQEYDVKFYFLDLTVENNTVDISGNVTVKALPVVSLLDTFAFELIPEMVIDTVFVNGVQKSFSREGDLVMVPVSPGLPSGSLFSVRTCYHGTPPTGGFFSGVTTDYNSQYDKQVTWSLSEPYAAKDWWPTKQDLQDKIDSVWVFLTTSQGNMAGSQGLLKAVTPLPGNKVRYEWKSYYPIDYYLISFAVADYMEYNVYAHPAGTNDSVLIQNFIYDHPTCLSANKEAIDQTAEFIELFSDLFGLYPFIEEKYGHCLTELGGGMEHQTMTTLGGFNFGLVAHELGHMWFGDKVTCATWSDIWINEGFATYSDYLAHSYLADPIYDSIWLKIRHDQVKNQPGGSVYVPEEELGNIWRIFDGRLSYSKGALLLHMIRFELQDDSVFFDVLRTYMEEYGDSVATGDDFREWLELISGQDFTDFFNQWYYGEGYPVFDITWYQHEGMLNISSAQSTSTTITPLFKMTVPYYLKFDDGTDSTLLLFQDSNLNHYSVPIPKTIESLMIDPDQWILHRLNSLILSVDETNSPVQFTLGPNPAENHFRVYLEEGPYQSYELELIDFTGRLVYSQILSEPISDIRINDLSGGMYFVIISDGTHSLTRKILINN